MTARFSKVIMVVGIAMAAVLLATTAPAQTRAIHGPGTPNPTGANSITTTLHWQDELVDGLGLVGAGSSIALDENGYPHIAYYDDLYHTLRYAAWDGTAWQFDTIDSNIGVTPKGIFYNQTSIAVYGGTAYIAYDKWGGTAGNHFVSYAFGGIGGWTISALSPVGATQFAYGPSLVLDSGHNPQVVYAFDPEFTSTAVPQQIIYARLFPTTTTWVMQTVGEEPTDRFDISVATRLALDRNDQPHIAYVGVPLLGSGGDLRYAHQSGLTWQGNTVDTNADYPSIAVDSAGNPHVAYKKAGRLTYASWNGYIWLTQQLTNTYAWSVLALDAFDNPHIVMGTDYLQGVGTGWQTDHIADIDYAQPALALDRAGNAHISYFDINFEDLHHVFLASDWQTQTVATAGGDPHLAVDLHNHPFISYRDPDHYNVSLANWTSGGDWNYHAVVPAAPYSYLRLLYGVNHEALPILSYYNYDAVLPSQYDLGFAQWTGATFITQTLTGTNNPGGWLAMAADPGGEPVIGYYDAAIRRIKYAVGNGGGWTFRTDTIGPLVHNPWLSIGSSLSGNTYIAYADDLSPTLRLATYNGTQWTDELIDSANHFPVGINVSLAVDHNSGKPAMAYFDATHGVLKYVFWRGAWITTTVDTGLPDVSSLSLALAAFSDQYPRITYATAPSNTLRLAWSIWPSQTWTIETIGTFPSVSNMEVSSQVQTRDHIAYSQPSTGVIYAFRSSTLQDSIYYNPLRPCPELTFTLGSVGPALSQIKAMKPTDLSQVDDLTTLRALRDMLALSPMARHYIDLYYQYAPETGALALADPSLMWDGYRTLQNFLPGLASLAAGNGDAIVITQSMVDEVNNILDRLVTVGSPALQSTINQERTKYNHLQVFVGQTFTQATTLVGINLTPNKVYLPIVRK